MCVWVLHLGLATIPGAKPWAPLSTALPHWAPTTTSELSCFTGLRTQETERSHTLHPPHRTPWDCNLARRVWILETQHILACTDYNYSQLLLNYSCLTLGVFLYIHLTIKCQCANLFCGFTVGFFFPSIWDRDALRVELGKWDVLRVFFRRHAMRFHVGSVLRKHPSSGRAHNCNLSSKCVLP